MRSLRMIAPSRGIRTFQAQSGIRFRGNGSKMVATKPETAVIPLQNGLIHRPQPSLGLFESYEKYNTNEDHEADRRIGAGEIVAFGKVVDELPKAAEIDQKFSTDNVDKGEDQSEADADKDRRQCRRKEDFPELLRRCQVKAAPDIHEDPARAGNSLDGFQDDRRERRQETHHNDRPGVAAEDDHEQRIGQHQRCRCKRSDPCFAGPPQQVEALHDYADADAAYGDHHACEKALAGGEKEPVDNVLLGKQAAKTHYDFGWRRHDKTVEQSETNKAFDKQQTGDKRAKAHQLGGIASTGEGRWRCRHRHDARSSRRSALFSSSRMPRFASSRRSFQISATYRPKASLPTISEVRGRGRSISTMRFTLPGR